MSCNWKRKCYGPKTATIAALLGTLLCVGFALSLYFLPQMFQAIVVKMMVLTPSSMMYPGWSQPPITLKANVYLFNYSNHEEFMANWSLGVKPKVEQVGPYTYTVSIKKVFIDWSEPPYVAYRQIHYFYFHPELSVGKESDEVIVPNIIGLSPTGVNVSSWFQKMISFAMKKFPNAEPPFIKVSVGDLLVYGYEDKVLKLMKDKFQIEILPEGKFALLYGQNATDDGLYKIDTGAYNPDNMYKIVEWNGKSSMESIWNNKYCGMFNGSDPSMYPPPGHTRFDRIYWFLSIFRKTFYADYKNDLNYKGIDCYNFQTPLDYYADYNINPDNYCYTDGNPDLAYASGVLFIGKLADGIPFYISNPHFLDGDFRLVDDVDGINPNEDHRTNIAIMPETGAPIKVDIKMQMNILMRPNPHIRATKDWPTVMLPYLWGNMSVHLDDEMSAWVRRVYYGSYNLFKGFLITFTVVNGITAVAGISCSYYLMFQFKKSGLEETERDEFAFQDKEEDKNQANETNH
ncbi:scavenger receptor class B, member [Chamberlinius hualienensis]